MKYALLLIIDLDYLLSSDSTKKFYADYLAPQSHQTGATSKKAAYVPPDHTARIPVIQEKADLCYEGKETFVVTSSTTTK